MNRKKFLGLLGLAAATPILAKGLEPKETAPDVKELKPELVGDVKKIEPNVYNFGKGVSTISVRGPFQVTDYSPTVTFSAKPYEESDWEMTIKGANKVLEDTITEYEQSGELLISTGKPYEFEHPKFDNGYIPPKPTVGSIYMDSDNLVYWFNGIDWVKF